MDSSRTCSMKEAAKMFESLSAAAEGETRPALEDTSAMR
jgi:hypothetical protein